MRGSIGIRTSIYQTGLSHQRKKAAKRRLRAEWWTKLRAFREAPSVEDLNKLADKWNYIYNYERPHQGFGNLTLIEYFSQWREESGDRDRVSAT